MGHIQKQKNSYHKIDISEATLSPDSLTFEIDNKTWCFESFAQWGDRFALASQFADVFWRRRHDFTNRTRESHLHSYKMFWKYLDDYYPELQCASEITDEMLSGFAIWLKNCRTTLGISKPLSFSTQRKNFGAIKAVLEFLQQLDVVKRTNKLQSPVYRSSNYNEKRTPPYSRPERARIVQASKTHFEAIKEGTVPNDSLMALIPYIFMVGIRTGVNLQPLLELPIDPCKPGLIDGRHIITFYKNRGYSTQNIQIDESHQDIETLSVTKRVVTLLKEVEWNTRHLRKKAPPEIANDLWLYSLNGEIKTLNTRRGANAAAQSARQFAHKYCLMSDIGTPLNLVFKRLRPTFAHAILRLNGGDIRDLQKRLNHKNINTTARYLDPKNDDFVSSFKFSGQVFQVWATNKNGSVDITGVAEQLNVTTDEAEKIVDGLTQMSVGRCKNPYDSKFSLEGEPCTNFMACFRCSNQIIAQEDAYKVFSFYWYLLSRKNEIPKSAWDRGYAWIIRIIEEDVTPQLKDASGIKEKARINPHPAWPNGRQFIQIAEID